VSAGSPVALPLPASIAHLSEVLVVDGAWDLGPALEELQREATGHVLADVAAHEPDTRVISRTKNPLHTMMTLTETATIFHDPL